MTKRLFALTLAAAAVLAAPDALAQQGSPGKGPVASKMFTAMDTDGNGAVSQAEFDAFHADKFKTLDANGDGAMSAEEMAAPARDRKMQRCESMGCQCAEESTLPAQ